MVAATTSVSKHYTVFVYAAQVVDVVVSRKHCLGAAEFHNFVVQRVTAAVVIGGNISRLEVDTGHFGGFSAERIGVRPAFFQNEAVAFRYNAALNVVVHVGIRAERHMHKQRRLNVAFYRAQPLHVPGVPLGLFRRNFVVQQVSAVNLDIGIHVAVNHTKRVQQVVAAVHNFDKIVTFALDVARTAVKQTVLVTMENFAVSVLAKSVFAVVIAVHKRPVNLLLFHKIAKILYSTLSKNAERKVACNDGNVGTIDGNCLFKQVKSFNVLRHVAELYLRVGNLHNFQRRLSFGKFKRGHGVVVLGEAVRRFPLFSVAVVIFRRGNATRCVMDCDVAAQYHDYSQRDTPAVAAFKFLFGSSHRLFRPIFIFLSLQNCYCDNITVQKKRNRMQFLQTNLLAVKLYHSCVVKSRCFVKMIMLRHNYFTILEKNVSQRGSQFCKRVING